jgi:hypothetical protein
MVTVPLADSAELFRQFRRGRVLLVGAASQVFEFRLDGTSQLLASLLDCVRTKGAGPQVANPFVGQSPAPSASPPVSSASSHAHQAEAAVTLSNILSEAGVKGFTIASGSERPGLKADASWTAGQDLAGSLRVLPDVSTGHVQKIQSILIGDDAQSCKGSFASGAIPEKNGDFMLRMFTACELQDPQALAEVELPDGRVPLGRDPLQALGAPDIVHEDINPAMILPDALCQRLYVFGVEVIDRNGDAPATQL